MLDAAQQVLKIWLALFCSLTLNHIAPTLNYSLSPSLSQREGWGELSKGLGCVFDDLNVSSTTRRHEMSIYSHPIKTSR
jgi:hypothetical protein